MKRFIMTTALLMSAVVMLPAAAEAKGIKSISAARKKALREVKSAVVTEADIDYENGGIVYEIDLAKGNRDYTLIYRGSDGKLMEYEWDIENMEYNRQGKKNISKAQIKEKAKKKVKKAKITSAVLRYDDGLAEYKVILKTSWSTAPRRASFWAMNGRLPNSARNPSISDWQRQNQSPGRRCRAPSLSR